MNPHFAKAVTSQEFQVKCHIKSELLQLISVLTRALSLGITAPRGRILELDGLRAVSVLAILLFHFGVDTLSGGYVGVDVFFVLSGYLITSNILGELRAGCFSFWRFYHRRARRLLPAFFVILFLTLVFATFLLAPVHLERLSRAAIYSAVSLANFFFLGEAGYFDTSAAFKPLLHFWSLAVEEQFYLVWPAFLVLIVGAFGRKRIVGALLVVCVISLFAAEIALDNRAEIAFYMMPFRAYEFALGALCCSLHEACAKDQCSKALRSWSAATGLTLIVLCCFLFDEQTRFPGIAALIPCVGAMLVILFGDAGQVGALLRSQPMVALGTISYSLYLVHWPVVVLFFYWAGRRPTPWDAPWLVLVSVVGGALLYRHVETRFILRENASSMISAMRSAFGLATPFVLTIGLALFIWHGDGLHWRLSETDLIVRSAPTFNCAEGGPERQIGKSCRLGETVEPRTRLLVLGDSHAEQLRTGFDQLGKRLKMQIDFWTMPGCPPLWGTYKRYGAGYEQNEEQCKSVVPLWEKQMTSGEYPFVMLASRWMWLFEPESYAHTIVRRDLLVDRVEPIDDTGIARALFAERLPLTVAKIVDSGAKVIVMSQVPLLGHSIQYCDQLPTLLYTERMRIEKCAAGVGRSEALGRLHFSNEVVAGIGSVDTHVIVPSDFLCGGNDSSCITVHEDRSLYLDDNHLSEYGSVWFADLLEDRLRDFISAPSFLNVR